MESHLTQPSRVAKVEAGIVFVLALAFAAFFDVTKHDPSLAAINPFADDPYDAIGSFGIQAGLCLGLLSLIRAFRPYRAGAPSQKQWLLLLRAELAAVLAVALTLVGDSVALARHLSLWLGSPAGFRLSVLLGGLFLCAVATGALVCRSAWSVRMPRSVPPWRRAVLVSLVAVAVLGVYPERWRQSTGGALFTVVVGAVLLFAPLWAVLTALLPDHADERTPRRRTAAGGHFRHPYGRLRHPYRWAIVVCAGLLLGVGAFLAEATKEGMPQNASKVVFVLLVYAGLETAGVVIGYSFLSAPLGLIRVTGR